MGLVLQACLSAVLCQMGAVLCFVKGQLLSFPPVSTHTCFLACQVVESSVQVRHRV